MRVLLTFYSKCRAHELALMDFPKEGVRISDGRNDARIYYEGQIGDISDVSTIVRRFAALQCICHSVKIFTPGQIPKLEDKGFEFNGIFHLKPINTRQVKLAYSVVPYGPHEWCLMIEHRRGSGVPIAAIEKLPYYDVLSNTEQLKLSV